MHEQVLQGPSIDDRTKLVVGSLALALIALASTIIAHLIAPLFGVVISLLFGFLIGAAFAGFAPTALVVFFLFQNLLISLASPSIGSEFALTAMRSTNFALTLSIWSVLMFSYIVDYSKFQAISKQVNSVALVMCLVIFYFAIGFIRFGEPSVIYFRNIFTPLIFLHISLIVFHKYNFKFTDALSVLMLTLLFYGYVEFAFDKELWEAFNGDIYARLSSLRLKIYPLGPWLEDMQQTGRVTRGIFESGKVHFFNFELFSGFDQKVHRPSGPNLHSVSFAYALAIISVSLFAAGKKAYLIAALPLLLLIGSKGATVFLAVCLIGFAATKYSKSSAIIIGYVGILAFYAIAAIVTAIALKNYHALGLIAGIEGFFSNPVGSGLGSSGILALEFSDIDWDKAQQTGKTDVVVESAIAVLLNQMGIAGVAIISLNIWLARKAWAVFQRTGERSAAVAAFMLLAITTNGIFHEEAMFAPLAQGMVMIMAGLAIARNNTAAQPPVANAKG